MRVTYTTALTHFGSAKEAVAWATPPTDSSEPGLPVLVRVSAGRFAETQLVPWHGSASGTLVNVRKVTRQLKAKLSAFRQQSPPHCV